MRRAQPDWAPRVLSRADQDALWKPAGLFARRSAGRRGVVLRRSDVPGVEKRFGAAGRVVEGEPMELLLWAAGRRDVARVTPAVTEVRMCVLGASPATCPRPRDAARRSTGPLPVPAATSSAPPMPPVGRFPRAC